MKTCKTCTAKIDSTQIKTHLGYLSYKEFYLKVCQFVKDNPQKTCCNPYIEDSN